MTVKQPAMKKNNVKLSEAEREQLNTLIQKGKGPTRQVLKARTLLKADASEAGDAWSDGRIAEALDNSIDTVAAPASTWWRVGSTPLRPASTLPTQPESASSTAPPRPSRLRSPARRRPRDADGGR